MNAVTKIGNKVLGVIGLASLALLAASLIAAWFYSNRGLDNISTTLLQVAFVALMAASPLLHRTFALFERRDANGTPFVHVGEPL